MTIFFVLLQYLQETLGDFVQSVYESEEECEVKWLKLCSQQRKLCYEAYRLTWLISLKKKDLGISWLVWRSDKELWNTEQSNDSSVFGGLKSSQGSVIITITQR